MTRYQISVLYKVESECIKALVSPSNDFGDLKLRRQITLISSLVTGFNSMEISSESNLKLKTLEQSKLELVDSDNDLFPIKSKLTLVVQENGKDLSITLEHEERITSLHAAHQYVLIDALIVSLNQYVSDITSMNN